MDEYLSTKELGWVLGRSAGFVRTAIKRGEIDGVLLPGGYRVARDEVLRVSREHVEAEAGRSLPDRDLERLIDDVIASNQQVTQS
jgi:hypothetical protein